MAKNTTHYKNLQKNQGDLTHISENAPMGFNDLKIFPNTLFI